MIASPAHPRVTVKGKLANSWGPDDANSTNKKSKKLNSAAQLTNSAVQLLAGEFGSAAAGR
jgi:hypothetical protein